MKFSPTKIFALMLANSALTLFILFLIIHYGSVGMANLFLNPLGVVKGLEYEQNKKNNEEEALQKKKFQEILKTKKDKIFDDSAPFIGEKNAKVQIVVFADYKCVYCKKLSQMETEILNDPKYKGKVKFIQMGFPILSQASGIAAIAAYEVFKSSPELFAKFHSELYEFQGATEEDFKNFAKKITKKEITLKNAEAVKHISSNLELGSEIGIRGTPGIIIGDELIGGLLPEADLKEKIDIQLAK